MKVCTVYLDQNVLTELRVSKLREIGSNFASLLEVLKRPEFQVIYSEYTLIEVSKVKSEEFVVEHLNVLNMLNAIYWNNQFPHKSPDSKRVYKDYFESKNSSLSQRLDYKNKKLIQSLNGIDTGVTAQERFDSLIDELVSTPFSLLSKKLPILKRPIDKIGEKVSQYASKKLNPLNEIEGYSVLNLIPDLREIINDSSYESIESYSPKEVFKEVERRLFNHDPNLPVLLSHNVAGIENKIEFLFLLLNWVAYFPDRFQNITNKKGLHNASMLDAKHASLAWHFDFIISTDEKFRKKAQACYYFRGSKAQVVSVEEFLKVFI